MKISRSKISTIIFIFILVLLIVPKTRGRIQIWLSTGMALISPSTIDEEKQGNIETYNWQLKDANGNITDFEDAKGKVVLVNFWATWCPPCIAEMPSFQKLYQDYQDKIVFLFISNETTEVTERFLKKKEYTFKTYSGVTENPKALNINGIPRTFLIDKSGNIVIDKTGAANWNSDFVRNTIDELLKE